MGMSFSQLWKMPLIIILLSLYIKRIKIKKPAFQNYSVWYAFKMLFNTNLAYRPFSNITEFARFLPLPLMFEYFKRKNSNSIYIWLIFLSQFVILSSIPFHFGLLESVGKQLSLQGFGYADIIGHTGIFQGAHAASITYTLAVIILINNLFHVQGSDKNRFYNHKFYNLILIGIGIYSIYAVFVRTGYLMFIVAVLVFIFLRFKFTFKRISIILVTIIIITGGIFRLVQSNDAFRARLFDQRIHDNNTIGSGRLIFWQNAYERWLNGNTFEIIFGIGMDNFKDYQYQKIGMRIFSHNQFFDSLVQNGLIGIILYLLMLISLFNFIRKRKHYKGYRLAMSLFAAYLMFALVQGSSLFFPDLMFALSLAYLFVNEKQSLHN
jgi:O-antigen ligase